MASDIDASHPFANTIQCTSAHHPAMDGIRKRRSPSEDATSIAGANNHWETSTFINEAVLASFVVADMPPPTPNEHVANGGMTTVNVDTTKNNGDESFWSRWKRDGSIARRLASMMNFFKSSLIFQFPTSLACGKVWRRRRVAAQYRTVIPNHLLPPPTNRRQKHPNRRYLGNKIKTTKYTVFTFLPKNLFEQFHRFANLYFVFVVLLNWIPQIEAFGKELAMIPVLFVLAVTAVKDVFEDRRRYLSDRKVNHATCRVFNAQEERYVKTEWKDVIVGDFVHLSCNEIIPADILLIRSSDPMGICYVETSNLDGESNLKQRHQGSSFSPMDFKSTVECGQPNNQIYNFSGFLLHEDGKREVASKNNLLLRGCEIRNTDFIEGIVLYAGHETKAMLNNSGPRYKRSNLERLMNWDIVWCVVVLLVMCFVGALGGGIWLSSFDAPYKVPYLAFVKDEGSTNPELEGFLVFWTYIIVLQIMIPISLYVSVEIVKLGQIFFISQDQSMYYSPAKKRIQCRALNIPEELGQIEYIMSDKTGTLTENQMIFRRCTIAGVDYGSSNVPGTGEQVSLANSQDIKETCKDVRPNVQLQQLLIAACSEQGNGPGGDNIRRQTYFDFFVNMAICNTVVVNPHPHSDRMNASGYVADESGISDMSAYSHNETGVPVSNGLLLKVAAADPSLVGQTPVELPSPRYPISRSDPIHNGPVSHHNALPMIITTDHAARAGDKEETLGSEESNDEGIATHGSGSKHTHEDESSAPVNDTGKSRPITLQLGKKLLQLPMLPKVRLPPMGRKTPITPTVSPGYRNPVYEAESPDELALVYASAAYGFRLVKRQLNSITVDLPNGELMKYEILHILPFDMVRKRMSIIVRHPKTKSIQLFCKGADSSVMELLSDQFCQSQRGQMYIYKSQEYLNLYASYGLRTLCLAKRELDTDEYEKWAANHEDAELSLDDDREQLIFHSALSIEKDMELVGVTGVEDRLQEGVADCISAIRNAGIKVWVLTGDKIETAVNIAYACKLFVYGMELIQLCTRNEDDADSLLQHHLDLIAGRSGDSSTDGSSNGNMALVVDGQTLTFFLTPKLEGKFVQLISHCASVLCCRTTPLQKASVVRLVKGKLEGMTLAIGDGANDVSMIQCADVGVGLSGQEGMQAVMASDFAMPQFRFLQRLLLVHGHWCYDRLARMVLHFFYKNAMFVFTLFWYQFFCGFTGQGMVDPLYMMLHNLLFTALPPLLLGIIDQDVPAEVLFEQHSLYCQGPRSLLYRTHSFWLNILDALWQSLVCYFFPHFMYNNSVTPMWSFGFLIESALVVCSNCQLLLILQAWTIPVIASVILSLLVFYGFAFAYNGLAITCCVADSPYWVAQRMIRDVDYWLALVIILVAALFPRFVTQTLVNTVFPSDVLKARIRYRQKSKKATADKNDRWLVKFTNRTKSVSFFRSAKRLPAVAPSEYCSNPQDCDCAHSSSNSDTAHEVRV